MPIELDGTTIIVEFQGGDPKGDSWGSPFTLDDIVAASIAGSWSPAVTKQGIQYLIPYSIYIIGADTYFLAENAQVYFEYHDNITISRLYVVGCHFKSQGDLHGMSWMNEYVSNNALWIVPEYGYIENSKFTRFNTTTFGGSISNNLIIKKTVLEACDSIKLANNNYGELENVTLTNSGSTNLQQWHDFVSAENVTIIDCPLGLYLYFITTLNIRKLKLINVTNHLKFRPRQSGQVLNCFDSNIDVSSYNYLLSGTGDITANNISTFKINIDGGDDGTAKLYDKDDNLIFSEVLSGELEKEVVFEMMEFDTVAAVITKELLTTFEPFKLVVTKDSYQDLTIPDIAINPGSETHIFGKMIEPPDEIYYQRLINASILEDEVSGSIETVEVSGIINT